LRQFLFYLLLAGVLYPLVHVGSVRGAEEVFSIEPVVWEWFEDYPGANQHDYTLPVNRVYLKTHDGTDWMSVYDTHPAAIGGPDALKRAIDMYRAQGIDVVAWFVPKGWDIELQLTMARIVLDSGVAALYADIEPYPGFCFNDCAFLAREFWPRLREQRPNSELGVIYDPRPEHWADAGLYDWMRLANTALPMCYWSSFVDQPPWNDPVGCIEQAHADLGAIAPGVPLQYTPMLQGDAAPDQVKAALVATKKVGSSRASLWRRGVVSAETWAAVAEYQASVTPPPPPPPDLLPKNPCERADERQGRRGVRCQLYGMEELPRVARNIDD
jgi:hypothetical protein